MRVQLDNGSRTGGIGLVLAGLCLIGAIAFSGCSKQAAVQTATPAQSTVRVQRPTIERFDPAKYKGPTGRIVTSLKGDSMLYVYAAYSGRRGPMMLKSKDGTFVAPAGDYELLQYCMMQRGQYNKERPGITGGFGRSNRITITDGSTHNLKIGPPFTASIKVSQISPGTMQLDLQVTGVGGDKCRISAEAPGFQILSPSGKMLQEGKFRYG